MQIRLLPRKQEIIEMIGKTYCFSNARLEPSRILFFISVDFGELDVSSR